MIPISNLLISKNAKKYLLECLNSGWVSSKGPFVNKFERAFAKFVGTKYAVATSSGTTAIHLALATLDIKPGDEVIIPTLTMIAAALPIIYCQAVPVLVDAEAETGNIDTSQIEAKITKKTKAIIIVHLNGHPVDMKPVLLLAKKYHLKLIEDAAESHGAKYQIEGKWKMVGSIGNLGCFSFYGNKLVTTGEGGMVTTNNKVLADRLRSLRNLARSTKKHFFHQKIAFAYRMSSLQAALGLAQLEQVEEIIKIKKKLAEIYLNQLSKLPEVKLPIQKPSIQRIYWNFDILVNSKKDTLVKLLDKNKIESRVFPTPLHLQPAFKKLGLFKGEKYPVAQRLSKIGLSLPLGPNMTRVQLNKVCDTIKRIYDQM